MYRTIVFNVSIAMKNPTQPTDNERVICQNLSCTWSECLAVAKISNLCLEYSIWTCLDRSNATALAKIHGGAQSSNVMVLL